ncbi:MAG: arsenate reductase ArsC [Trueperaceae bacterium]|nr:arsenate reductase ArsC [Trueperaceae bacterium]
MAEGWIRHHAHQTGLEIEVHSAGTERTRVKSEALTVMAEVGIDLGTHTSKRLDEIDDPWTFDVVLTVCDDAHEACPVYPAATARRHVSFPDPSGAPLGAWRDVRDAIGAMSRAVVDGLGRGAVPPDDELTGAAAMRVRT